MDRKHIIQLLGSYQQIYFGQPPVRALVLAALRPYMALASSSFQSLAKDILLPCVLSLPLRTQKSHLFPFVQHSAFFIDTIKNQLGNQPLPLQVLLYIAQWPQTHSSSAAASLGLELHVSIHLVYKEQFMIT